MKLFKAFLILPILLLSSCSITSTLTQNETKLNRQAEVASVPPVLVNRPILTSLTFGESRVSSTLETNSEELGLNNLSGTGVGVKSSAIKIEAEKRSQFLFLEEHDCDFILDPIYKTTLKTDIKANMILVTVELSAFPATINSFSQPDSLPKSVFQLSNVDDREVPLSIASKTVSTGQTSIQRGWVLGGTFATSFERDENLQFSIEPSSGLGTDIRYFSKINFNENIGLIWEAGLSLRQSGYYFGRMNEDDIIQWGNTFGRFPVEGRISTSRVGVEVPFCLNIRPQNWIELFAGPSVFLGIMELQHVNYSWSDIANGEIVGTLDEGISIADDYGFNFGFGMVYGVSILGKNNVGMSLRWQNSFGDDGLSGATIGLILPVK